MLRQSDQLPSLPMRLFAGLMCAAIRCLSWTWRVEYSGQKEMQRVLAERGAVFAFWHGEQLPLIPIHVGYPLCGLASLSRDGGILAAVISSMGFSVIRGSSSSGGVSAVRNAVAHISNGVSPALAVDGPRGPRHRVALGAVAIASHAKVPVVYAVSRVRWAIRLRTWDGFQIPLPFTRMKIVYGVMQPSSMPSVARVEVAQELQRRMRSITDPITFSENDLLDDSVLP